MASALPVQMCSASGWAGGGHLLASEERSAIASSPLCRRRRTETATFVQGREITSKAEPVGLLTEGAAGIAAIVLAILGLAGVSTGVLASITVIVIGVGLLVQGFNTGAEQARATSIANQRVAEFGAEVMV
ncbi:MAG: hypothetical protein JO110_15330, partial [Acetobacteraceae bacterium]|nr:hypothetical protein [Acetobacteraceae bacterium]